MEVGGQSKCKDSILRVLANCQEGAPSHCICLQAWLVPFSRGEAGAAQGGYHAHRGLAAPGFHLGRCSLHSIRPPPALTTGEPSIPARKEVTRPPRRFLLPPSAPPPVPICTPPQAPPASRTGSGVVEREFSAGFKPRLVTEKLLSPSTAGPQEPRQVQGLSAVKQRARLAVTGHSPGGQSQPFPWILLWPH